MFSSLSHMRNKPTTLRWRLTTIKINKNNKNKRTVIFKYEKNLSEIDALIEVEKTLTNVRFVAIN